MNYRHHPVPDHLKSYVQCYWILENPHAGTQPSRLGPLADGFPGLMFHQTTSGKLYDQHQEKLPDFFLYGQSTSRTELYLTETFRTLGVCLQPHALNLIFNMQATEVADRCVDIGLLHRASQDNLQEKLVNAKSLDEQFDFISQYLWANIQASKGREDAATLFALRKIIQSNGVVSLPDIRDTVNLSERSFERRFGQYIGISPKVFSNICRFQSTLHQLRHNQYARLSDIAFDHGYADQSHFIRSFKAFAGYSPFQYRKESQQQVIVPVMYEPGQEQEQ
jgi:AraC-like DNA-binding protein